MGTKNNVKEQGRMGEPKKAKTKEFKKEFCEEWDKLREFFAKYSNLDEVRIVPEDSEREA